MNHPLLAVHLAHLPLAVLVLPARHAHFLVHANRNRVRAVLRLEFARERRGHELPALARRRGEVRLARFTTGRGDRGRVLHRARRQEADVERSRAQGFRAHRAGERPPPTHVRASVGTNHTVCGTREAHVRVFFYVLWVAPPAGGRAVGGVFSPVVTRRASLVVPARSTRPDRSLGQRRARDGGAMRERSVETSRASARAESAVRRCARGRGDGRRKRA